VQPPASLSLREIEGVVAEAPVVRPGKAGTRRAGTMAALIVQVRHVRVIVGVGG
jgi:hypothetical protein